ncbi:MAG: helix-turn-helix domain-containing protein [Bacteroidia bacterium]
MGVFSIWEVSLIVLATMSALCGLLVIFISQIKRESKRYLGLYFLIFAVVLILYQDVINDKDWNLLTLAFYRFIGVLHTFCFYAFVKSVFFGPIKYAKSPFIWFPIPLFFSLILLVLVFYENPPGFLVKIMEHRYLSIIEWAYAVTLFLLSIKVVYDYKKTVRDTVSDLSIYQHKWVLSIIGIKISYTIIPISWSLLLNLLDIPNHSSSAYFIASVVVFVYLLSLILITLFYSSKTLSLPSEDKTNSLSRLISSPESHASPNEELTEVFQQVHRLFENEQIYETPDLKLDTLASRLEISARSISAAINSCGGKNFYEFVNEFRIRAAKMILEQNEDVRLTMQEVMFDVGYSSKSSFNKEFKKNTGLTPLQYRKKMSANT